MRESRIGADYTLTIEEMISAASLVIDSGRVPMVWGAPGLGKSDGAREVARRYDATMIDVRLPLMDPVEIHGMPYRDAAKDVMRWSPPEMFPRKGDVPDDEKFLLVFDEISGAPPATQAAAYQIILDRAVGQAQLADGVMMMAAGNEEGQGAVSHRMSTALANRFRHLYVRADVEAWQNWALVSDIALEVQFFITHRPDLLHVFEPVKGADRENAQARWRDREHAFPSPRTWEFVSDQIKSQANGGTKVSPGTERALFVGTVGEAAAAEFSAFLRIWRDLPHPQTIFDDPLGVTIPEDVSVQVALCGSLVRAVDDTNFDALVAYADRVDMRRELGEFLVSRTIKAEPALQYTKAYNLHLARRHAA